jgi:uncharacterized DUF497 family protein
MGRDTMVALGPATRAGITVFAKKADRPPRECQRIVQLPAARHPEDWDAAYWRKSELKHGVAVVEAEEVLLNDPVCQVDVRHSGSEQRYVALGTTNEGAATRGTTVRRSRVRVISARPMSRREAVGDPSRAPSPRVLGNSLPARAALRHLERPVERSVTGQIFRRGRGSGTP